MRKAQRPAARPGTYRRRFIITTDPASSRADLEDDSHRFSVALVHDGRRVLSLEADALRTPWNLCGGATDMLQRLVGMPLEPDPRAVYRHTDGKLQCTHQFELAGLAIAHAARGTTRRQYDIEVPVATMDAPLSATLRSDGVVLLSWTVERDVVTSPAALRGRNVRTLVEWAYEAFPDPDLFEGIVLLRRAMQMAGGSRVRDVESMDRAAQLGDRVLGACYVFRPGMIERAHRNPGMTQDFTDRPEALLSDLPRQRGRVLAIPS